MSDYQPHSDYLRQAHFNRVIEYKLRSLQERKRTEQIYSCSVFALVTKTVEETSVIGRGSSFPVMFYLIVQQTLNFEYRALQNLVLFQKYVVFIKTESPSTESSLPGADPCNSSSGITAKWHLTPIIKAFLFSVMALNSDMSKAKWERVA